ncbi:MAG: endonuclease/exonuclease/phosphatase family protein [Ruminococcus sp.]|nr:endonuclease/exonuclease/phosphatase family protein [Ruminococcus sp.]
MEKKKHIWWKILLGVVATVLIIVIAYLLYVILTYNRIEDNQPLNVNSIAQSEQAEVGKTYTAVTYNIGFGAYTPDFTFFMDGGTQSWANSKESVERCIEGVAGTALDKEPDIVLYQEVDTDSTRSYHVNEADQIRSHYSGFNDIFAVNYHSAFLMYPFTQPHGASNSGLLTLSDMKIISATRRSFPISTGFSKFLDLDRCFSVSHIPADNGKELVIYNVHASAYGVDAEIQHAQFEMLFEDMKSEYDKGNFVVCGGDFNHDFTGNSKEKLNENVDGEHTWAAPFPDDLIPEGFEKQTNYKNNGLVATTRNCDIPYSEDSFTVILDGFITSDNVKVKSVENIQTDFEFSDHNPVVIEFELK